MNKILAFLFLFLITFKAEARQPLRLVGSSAIYPFAATVAEHFGYKTNEPIPIVEALGTGGGISLFCKNPYGPDGVMASRQMTRKEMGRCRKAGVTFQEFTIGKDGLVFIRNKEAEPFPLTLSLLRAALAESLPFDHKCIPNANMNWSDIQPDLPPYAIRVLGPAPTSGTYDVLVERLTNPCGSYLRPDGGYSEAPANENLIVQKILVAPQTLGLITFSFYRQNQRKIYPFPIEGILPTLNTIQNGSYALSRPLYMYIKTNDLKNNMARLAYIFEFLSPSATGENGYLLEKGLIPLDQEEQKRMQDKAHVLLNRVEGSR